MVHIQKKNSWQHFNIKSSVYFLCILLGQWKSNWLDYTFWVIQKITVLLITFLINQYQTYYIQHIYTYKSWKLAILLYHITCVWCVFFKRIWMFFSIIAFAMIVPKPARENCRHLVFSPQGSQCGHKPLSPPVPPPAASPALSALPGLSQAASFPQEYIISTGGEFIIL